MNRKWFFIIPLLLLVFMFETPLYGDGLDKVAQAGMKWLSIPIGARGNALGGAYTALANDAGSIFWNPAGLAYTEGRHLFLTQNQWIAGIRVNAGAVSWNTGNWGVFGASFATVDWGTIHGTRRANNAQGFIETGDFSPDNYSIGISYARQISSKFSIGGNVKYLHENLGTNLEGSFENSNEFTAKTSILAFDFGTIYYTGFRDLRIAMSFQNFSKEVVYREEHFSLPLTFKIGAAMGISQFFMSESPHNLTFAVDALHPRDYSERVHFGLEYSFNKLFFLRGGYKTNYDQEDFTLGGGLNYSLGGLALGLDYSYISFQNFDAVHMFTFDFKF
jgi:hypothetical protein